MTDSPSFPLPGSSDTETSPTLDLRGASPARPGKTPTPEGGTWADGTEIAGRYRILRFLARGGLGEVYDAENIEMGERVALKMLRPEKAQDDDTVERFRREFQLARRVTHPNICRIYDAGLHDDEAQGRVLYLTMELLEGETLEKRIRRLGRIDPEDARPIVRQICRALTAAHEVGVLHRDLKSSNIMLVPGAGQAERVVVTDFGLARAVRPSDDDFRTAAGSILGTPSAMSPEQVEGEDELTPATDIYSLGILMYEMLTGKLPFLGKSPLETALLRLTEDPPRASDRVGGLDPVWDAGILSCLARDPSRRPSSAEDVPGLLVHAPPPTLEPEPADEKGRLATWLPWVAAIILALGIGLGLGRVGDQSDLEPTVTSGPEPRLAERRIVQLTTAPGLDIDPVYSPDGKALVFASDRGGGLELWRLQLTAGGVARPLTADGGSNVQPDWSPDGEWIVFTSLARGGIWKIPAFGGRAQQLSTFGARPRYSPDGTRIVFQEDGRWDVSARSAVAQPGSTIWVIGAEGGEPVRWTRVGEPPGGHGEPNWTPDGRKIVFSGGDRRATGLWLVDRPEGPLTPLLGSDWRWAGSPVFEADGGALLFSGIRADEREAETHAVWRMPLGPDLVPSGPVQRVTRFGSSALRQIARSPGGEGLVYGSLETRSNLWEVELRDGRPVTNRPLTHSNGRSSRPAISPDGRFVAFDRWQTGRDLDLWVLDLARPEGEPRQVTLNEARDSLGSWTPDGRRLVFSSERSGAGEELWEIDVDDGSLEFVTSLGEDADWARLSPDGTRVSFHSRRESATLDIWLATLETGEVQRLTRLDEPIGFAAWSPDSRFLAAEIQRGEESVLAVVEVETGEVREVLAEAGKSWPYSWSPDGRWIAFAGHREDGWNLWAASLEGEVLRLTRHSLVDGYVRYPAWSSDGERIVYEVAETTGDLWLAEE